jgi:hypothetical protein
MNRERLHRITVEAASVMAVHVFAANAFVLPMFWNC